MRARIGTSGFLYEDWRGRFYPPSSRGRELEDYASRFDTVELNVTFYRMPAASTFRSWARRVPDDFMFAVKASRYLTHVRRLRNPGEPVARLMERALELGPHLGPVLLQLPPDMPADLGRLASTLDVFPPGIRVAVEPRHDSWFTEAFRTLLGERGVALCLADRRGPITPAWATADWGYVRFHGGRGRPSPCYAEPALARWAASIHDLWSPWSASTVFAFFNNDHRGCALRDAAGLAKDLVSRGVPIGRRPDIPRSVTDDARIPDASKGRAGSLPPEGTAQERMKVRG